MDDLSAIGFDIVGYGCTTCIGNSGPLPDRVARRAGWPGPARGHPVGQPELPRPRASGSGAGVPGVAATCDRLCAGRRRRARPGRRAAGRRRRRRAGPAARHLAQGRGNPGLSGRRPGRRRFRARLPGGAGQPRLACAGGALGHALSWRPDSTILRRPPFAALDAGSLLGQYTAHPLLVLGDDVTTDHISPASAIPPDSLVADFLAARGEDRRDLNVSPRAGATGK